jgi:hypothetical protein
MTNFRAFLLALLCFGQVAQAKAPLIFNGSNAKLLNSAAGQLVDANSVAYPRTGEKNYLTAASSTATGWAATSGVTVATTTSNLPRTTTTGSGILVSRASGSTAFAYTDIIIDPADYGKKLKVQFDMAPNSSYAANDQEVDVYTCTIAWGTVTPGVCSGTTARLPLSTDSSSLSLLPLLTGTYRTTFDAGGATVKWVQIQLGLHAATASSAVAYSDIIVGPGVVTQGAVTTGWSAYPPLLSAAGGGSVTAGTGGNTNAFAEYRRIGDSIQVSYQWAWGSSGTAFGSSGTYRYDLPAGLTVNYTALQANGTEYAVVGSGIYYDSSTTTAYPLVVEASNTGTVIAYVGTSTSGSQVGVTTPVTMAINDQIQVNFTVPVNEWAGSGTVNVVQNDVAYYYSAGNTWGTSNGSAVTSQGPGGVLGGTTTPAGTQFQYSFTPTTPIPVGAKPVLETSPDGIHWQPLGTLAGSGQVNIESLRNDGTTYFGAGVSLLSTGQLNVIFGKYPTGATSAWSTVGTWYWRVSVGLPGQAVGFSEVVPGTSAGLVSAAGLKGNAVTVQTANSYPTGVVGEYLERNATGNTSLTSSTIQDVDGTGITLTAGTWDITGVITYTSGASTSISLLSAWVGTASGSSTSGKDVNRNYAQFNYVSTGTVIGGQFETLTLPVWRVSISANTSYFLKTNNTFTASTLTANGTLRATRVL